MLEVVPRQVLPASGREICNARMKFQYWIMHPCDRGEIPQCDGAICEIEWLYTSSIQSCFWKALVACCKWFPTPEPWPVQARSMQPSHCGQSVSPPTLIMWLSPTWLKEGGCASVVIGTVFEVNTNLAAAKYRTNPVNFAPLPSYSKKWGCHLQNANQANGTYRLQNLPRPHDLQTSIRTLQQFCPWAAICVSLCCVAPDRSHRVVEDGIARAWQFRSTDLLPLWNAKPKKTNKYSNRSHCRQKDHAQFPRSPMLPTRCRNLVMWRLLGDNALIWTYESQKTATSKFHAPFALLCLPRKPRHECLDHKCYHP